MRRRGTPKPTGLPEMPVSATLGVVYTGGAAGWIGLFSGENQARGRRYGIHGSSRSWGFLRDRIKGTFRAIDEPAIDEPGGAMHAVVVRVTVKDVESSRQQLNEVVVPRAKQAPGFHAGFWTAPPGGSGAGLSMLIFDSEQNAQQAAQMVRGGPFPDGVQLEDVEVREVVASA